MIVFYRSPSDSPNMRKVSLMLAETALPHTVVHMQRQVNGKYPDELRAISPNATVPALVDNETGTTLFESGAILYYLAEKTGRLLPSTLQGRAEMMKWLMFEVANVGPAMGELYQCMLLDADQMPAHHLDRYKAKLAHYFEVLDKQLVGRDYLCGEYTIADIALYPWTAIIDDMADVALAKLENVSNWAARLDARFAARAA